MTIRVATRRSPLARRQAGYVVERLAALGVASELVPVDTAGDRDRDRALDEIGGQGVFVVEIQRVLLEGGADVAVHSAKDLPSLTPDGLFLCCVPERLDPADVLVGATLEGLTKGATVATGSPRRRALLLERRPDLNVVPLRGNMGARLSSVGRDGVEAIVTAHAALERLDEEGRITERLDPEWFIPQIGQGALALETRDGDEATSNVLAQLDDDVAHRALRTERAFLTELGAGCSVPVGALATVRHHEVILHGVMMAPDGSKSVRESHRGTHPELVGLALARRLRDELGGGALVGARD